MIANKLMVVTLLVLTGFCSCEKDEVKMEKKATIKQTPILNKNDGGDDDEDPIVQGSILKDGALVQNVTTDIFPDNSQISLGTTNQNGFQFSVPIGKYYLKVTPLNEPAIQTEVFNVSDDVQIDVNIE